MTVHTLDTHMDGASENSATHTHISSTYEGGEGAWINLQRRGLLLIPCQQPNKRGKVTDFIGNGTICTIVVLCVSFFFLSAPYRLSFFVTNTGRVEGQQLVVSF